MTDTNSDAAKETKPRRKRASRKKTTDDTPAAESSNSSSNSSDDDIIFGENDAPAPAASDDEGGQSNNQGGNRRGGNRRRGRRRRGGQGGQQQRGGGNWNQRGGGGGGGGGNRRQSRRAPVQPSDAEIVGEYEGVLELHPKGYGFLRDGARNYAAQESDPFVSSTLIEKYRLREGVKLKGEVGPGTRGQGPRLKTIESVEGADPEEYQKIKHFDDLTPVNPYEHIKLEIGPTPITMRVVDLLTPIGKGQRALIVAPPRTGKTMLLQDIADSVSVNHPELKLIVLLIDERPEEVTEMRRKVNGEVIASSMDREVESHVRISQLIFERAKRLAEAGGEVFVLLDSITRTARGVQQMGRELGANANRRSRHPRSGHSQEDVRNGAAIRGRRFADGCGYGADRHGQPCRRSDLSGVQRDGQHGTRPQPRSGRPSDLAGD